MDRDNALTIAVRYAKTVSQKYELARCLLFGSYAKNIPKRYSDIDIAVVVTNYLDYFDIQMDLMRLRRAIDTRIEPHLFRLEDFNNSDPFVREILEHGIEIHLEEIPAYSDRVAEATVTYKTK
ncbi:MAG: nucleotidyltransferase domain-containing protein [Petrimonas sp.]|nr:nucleotidyltransferase domain-containing protein [Petrimonas sp.]